MRRVLLTVVLLLACGGAARAQVRECLYNASPCEAYANADAVVLAQVTRVVQPPLQIWQRDNDYDQVTYLKVEKVFKGGERKTMVLHQLGRRNAPKFIFGQSYLFYANLDRATKKWEVQRCGRTRMIKYVSDDLSYMNGLPAALNKTRIAGEVTGYYTDEEEPQGRTERLAGVRLHIKGGGKEFEVVTDARGVYEVIDVPPGKYVLEPDLPAGMELMLVMHYGFLDFSKVRSLSVEVKEHGCSGVGIILTPTPRAKSTIGY